MPVLIDGNNLLFAVWEMEDPEHPISRSKLCAALGAWARATGERVSVVFDGPPPANQQLARQIGDPGLEITFSGSGIKADAVLIARIERDSAARRMLVVSTDREIRKAARRRRASSVTSAAFWEALRRELSRPPRPRLEPPEKAAGLEAGQTEAWLRELGFEPDGNEGRDE